MASRRVVVPVLVLAVALAIIFFAPTGRTPIVELPGHVQRCCTNLRAIYAGLVQYHLREGHLPEEAGKLSPARLFQDGIWQDTPEQRADLVCPGPHARGAVYAVRDLSAHPLAKFPSGGSELEPLLACPDTGTPAHGDSLNVLYSDGQVRTLALAQEIAAGRLPAGARDLTVGAGSPVPDLAKLVYDER